MLNLRSTTLTVLIGVTGVVVPTASDRQGLRLVDFIQRYDRGEQAFVVTSVAAVGDIRSFREEFQPTAADWVRAGPPAERPHRRLVAASLALETAAVHLEQHWYDVKPLVEWACRLIRSGAPSTGEHTWHLAALALIQGASDIDFLVGGVDALSRLRAGAFDHISHSRRRFPDEPRWQLAEALAFEADAWPLDRRRPANLNDLEVSARRALNARDARAKSTREDEAALHTLKKIQRLQQSADRWRRLLKNPHLREEAHLRLGYVEMRLGRASEALSNFRQIESSTDPDLLYLARLFAAWTQDEIGSTDSAIAAYRGALSILPMTPSAAVPLAARLYLAGRTDEAAEMAERLVAKPTTRDPWRQFGRGDYRHWPALLDDLRAKIR